MQYDVSCDGKLGLDIQVEADSWQDAVKQVQEVVKKWSLENLILHVDDGIEGVERIVLHDGREPRDVEIWMVQDENNDQYQPPKPEQQKRNGKKNK